MLRWRSLLSFSTPLRYRGIARDLQPSPLQVRVGRVGRGDRGRDGRLPAAGARGLDLVVLPGHRHRLADGARQQAARARRRALHDRAPVLRRGILRLRGRRDRRRDRARDLGRRLERAEEATRDRRDARPLHHLRLRPGRPPCRRGAPCLGRAVRRPRLQRTGARGREGAQRALRRRQRDRGRRPGRGRARPRTRARGRLRLRLGQPLHHALGPGRASRPADRRPRLRRGGREEARARRRRPGRASVRDRRADDGDVRGEAAGGGVPPGRLGRERRRPPARGDRGHRSGRPGGSHDRRAARSAIAPARPSSR